MGDIKVEVISRDTIKPSSPTPAQLNHLQLSFLDQTMAPIIMPFIFFYPVDGDAKVDDTIQRSIWLKKTLSETLIPFYPLAGRVKENSFIDCSDQGVPFLEAEVQCRLLEFTSHPDPMQINKFLPYGMEISVDIALAVQVNIFKCGGMAIGVCMSHKVADAFSMVMFVNSWAAVARSDTDFLCTPQFGLAKIFPPVNLSGFEPSTGIAKNTVITKRFVFTSSRLAALRKKYTDHSTDEDRDSPAGRKGPTRIEALSAFIWCRFVALFHRMTVTERVYTMLFTVNIRTRMDPPLPENYFGNIFLYTLMTPCMEDVKEGDSHAVAKKIREAVQKIDGEYVRKLREGTGHLDFLKEGAEKSSKNEVELFYFTSLCRFSLYEADFGWGKPLWVGSASLPSKNVVVFMDSVGSEGGIEAWINLAEEDMAKLQGDQEFLSFVSPT